MTGLLNQENQPCKRVDRIMDKHIRDAFVP